MPPPIAFAFGILEVRPELRPLAPIIQTLSLAIALIGYVMYRRTFVAVTATTIEERGFFGVRTSVPLDSIASVVLVQTYSGGSADAIPQLLVRDASKRRLLRLRGSYWTEDSVLAIADALQREVIAPAEPFTQREFFTRVEGGAYWWENKLSIVIAAGVLGMCAYIAIVVEIINLFGIANLYR